MSKNKYKSLASNTVIFAIGDFGSKIIMFFFLPLYTNILTKDEYGIAELVMTFATLIVPFISLSIADSVLRFGLDKKVDSRSVVQNALFVDLCGSVFLIFIIPLFSLYEPIRDYSKIMVVISILTALRRACQYYAKVINKNKIFAADSIINTLCLAVSNVLLLVYFKRGIQGYLEAQVIALGVSLVFLLLTTKVLSIVFFKRIDISLLREMIRYSAPMILNAVSWWLVHSTDKIMIQHYLNSGDVGIYTVASKIPSLINTVTYFFSQAWIIAAITDYDTEKDKRFYEKTFSYYNLVLCLIVSGILLVLKPFMSIYVGKDFNTSWTFVPFLLVAALFRNYSDFFGAFFSSAKKNVSIMLTTMLGAIVNIVLNAILIPQLGVQGAVLGTLGSYMTIGLYRLFKSRVIMPFHIDFVRTIASVTIIFLDSLFVILNIIPTICSIFSIIVLLDVNNKQCYEIIKVIKNKLSSKV